VGEVPEGQRGRFPAADTITFQYINLDSGK
jgi:hypothetical protein